MNDLVLGAAISLLSSLLILALTSYVQWKREKRIREWALEDYKTQRHFDTLKERLKDITNIVNIEFDITQKIISLELKAVNELHLENENAFLEIEIMIDELRKICSPLFNFGDRELQGLANDLTGRMFIELDEAHSLCKRVANIKNGEDFQREWEKARLQKFSSETFDLRTSIFKRIDKLSGLNI